MATDDEDVILAEVEKFLAVSGMTPTAFGHRALNDPTLVHEMRNGRECKRATRARIREFIQSWKPSGDGHPSPLECAA